MNWSLNYKQIAQALFFQENFEFLKDKNLERKNVFIGRNFGDRNNIAVCISSKDFRIITLKEFKDLINKINKKYHSQVINFYTNLAIAARDKDLGDSIFIRKIPQTILRKYKVL